jgi:RHS repeat-associated protein
MKAKAHFLVLAFVATLFSADSPTVFAQWCDNNCGGPSDDQTNVWSTDPSQDGYPSVQPNYGGTVSYGNGGGNGNGASSTPNYPPISPAPDDYKAGLYPTVASPASIDDYVNAVKQKGGMLGGLIGVMYDTTGKPLGTFSSSVGLPVLQATSRNTAGPAVPNSDPVSSDGEFSIEETDVSLAGYGLPFRFTRYYRSGVEFQSDLGAGWNHNFGLKIVEAKGNYDSPQGCSAAHNDVFLVTERMDTIRFVFQSSDDKDYYYVNRAGGSSYRLHKETSGTVSPWVVEDGHGSVYRFNASDGTLASVADYAGHTIRLQWQSAVDPNTSQTVSRLSSAVDTTGRVINFIYVPVFFFAREYGISLDDTADRTKFTYVALQCLSTGTDCSHPLVSFQAQGAVRYAPQPAPSTTQAPISAPKWSCGASDSVTNGENASASAARGFVTDSVEIELKGVTHPNGTSESYEYYDGEQTVLPSSNPFDEMPSLVGAVCTGMCGSTQSDCRNSDICGADLNQKDLECNSVGSAGSTLCYNWCMSEQTFPVYTKPLDSKGNDRCPAYGNECHAAVANLLPTLDSCRATCKSECLAQLPAVTADESNIPRSLSHDLLKVTDGDGRLVVENRYGEQVGSPDFDKVIYQWQPNASPNRWWQAVNGQTITYYDASNNTVSNPSDAKYIQSSHRFFPMLICPADGGPPRALNLPTSALTWQYATVVHDAVGTVWVNYYDGGWHLLRSVNQTAGLTQNYNYQNGALSAVLQPSGQRECLQNDDGGRPVDVVQSPAPGYPGNAAPRETAFEYDNAGFFIQSTRNVTGNHPSGEKIVRDQYERVIAVGEQVDALKTDWTCYAYADSTLSFKVMWADIVGAIGVGAASAATLSSAATERRYQSTTATQQPGANPATDGVARFAGTKLRFISLMFQPSGCALPILRPNFWSRVATWWSGTWSYFLPHTIDAIPSTITHPDGSVTTNADLSQGGPQTVTRDANGPDPITSYYRYDDRGRPSEYGRVLSGNSGSQQVALRRWYFDDSDQLYQLDAYDVGAGAWWTTHYGYDKSSHMVSIDTPDVTRTLTVSSVGDVLLTNDVPKKPGTGDPQAMCQQHDGNGRLVSAVLPEGNIVNYSYTSAGQLAQFVRGYAAVPLAWATGCSPVVAPLISLTLHNVPSQETVASMDYDSVGNPSGTTTDGVHADLTVDGFGRIIATRILQGTVALDHTGKRRVVYQYRVRSYDDDDQIVWEGIFDQPPPNFAKPTALAPGMHALAEYEHDLLGRLTKETHWRFTEDPLAATSDGLLATTGTQYDDTSDTVTTIDPAGRKTVLRMDGLGRLVSKIDAAGTPDQSTLTLTFSNGATKFDSVLDPAPTSAGKLTRSYDIDLLGNVRAVTENGNAILTQDFDYLGRMTKRMTLGSGVETFDYDAFGRVAAWHQLGVGQNGQLTTLYKWDRNGRLQSATDAEDHTTTYGYDGLDRASTITDGIGTARYTFEPGTGRIAQMTTPSGGTRVSSYDYAGRLASLVATANGSTLTRAFTYTALNQIATATQTGGQSNFTAFQYDSIGRTISEANDATSLYVVRTYGDTKNALRLGLVNGLTTRISETLDALQRPHDIAMNDAVVASIQYDRGAPASIAYANGTHETFSYDDDGRLAGADVGSTSGSLAQITDVFGADNIVRARSRAFGTIQPMTDLFTLDPIGRLLSENLRLPAITLLTGELTDAGVLALEPATPASSSYSLDGTSNWTARNGAVPFQATDSKANQLDPIDGQSVIYDGDGNVTAEFGNTYGWNAFGELASETVGGETVSYQYDGLGRRLRETFANSSDAIIWDGGRILGFVPKSSGNAPQIQIGTQSGQVLGLANLGDAKPTVYLHPGTDRSTLAATDAGGSLAEGYAYSAYGEVTVVSPTGTPSTASGIGNRYLYEGYLQDPAAGTQYLRNREYQPSLGRFLSPDPLGLAGGQNLYAYVGARPLDSIDPLGLSGNRNAHTGTGNASTPTVTLATTGIPGTSSGPESLVANWLALNESRLATAQSAGFYLGQLATGHSSETLSITNLWHWMDRSGQPITVQRDWVMGGWGNDYQAIMNLAKDGASAQASASIGKGQQFGNGSIRRSGSDLNPNEPRPLAAAAYPVGQGADQFYGSGHADLSVDLNYSYYPINGASDQFELRFDRAMGRFSDFYVFERDVNPIEWKVQEAGAAVPFRMDGAWSDPQGTWVGTRSSNGTFRWRPSFDLPSPPDLSSVLSPQR